MAKDKRHELIINWEENSDEMEIIGICSHVPMYRLVWDLNQLLHLKMRVANSLLEVYTKKGKVIHFPYYYDYGQEQDFMEIYLVKNKHEGNTLIPELFQIDFFLFFINNQLYSMKEIHAAIKEKNRTVSASFVFDAGRYESTDFIIFEKEKQENNEEN